MHTGGRDSGCCCCCHKHVNECGCEHHESKHVHRCCCASNESGHHQHHHGEGEHRHHHGSRQEHRFHRHFATRDERLTDMEVYLRDLQAEVKAVEEQIADLKKTS
jgi:hypothetical protein